MDSSHNRALYKCPITYILGNGEIDFDEFVLLVERCSKPASNDQEIRDMFNAIDKDRSGFVDADELKETFVALGIPLSDQDVRGMMTEAGVKDSHIYYEGSSSSSRTYRLTPSTPAVPNSCCSKGSAPYWSKPPFLIFDIRALWRSGLSARAPECQKLKMVA